MPLIPALRRGRRIFEFEASLVYRASSRTARATQRNSVSRKKKKRRSLGDEEMAWQLRVLDALAEVLGLNPNTHMAAHNYLPL
jgi:hypothetical protein